jgi:hypothetical protein
VVVAHGPVLQGAGAAGGGRGGQGTAVQGARGGGVHGAEGCARGRAAAGVTGLLQGLWRACGGLAGARIPSAQHAPSAAA